MHRYIALKKRYLHSGGGGGFDRFELYKDNGFMAVVEKNTLYFKVVSGPDNVFVYRSSSSPLPEAEKLPRTPRNLYNAFVVIRDTSKGKEWTTEAWQSFSKALFNALLNSIGITDHERVELLKDTSKLQYTISWTDINGLSPSLEALDPFFMDPSNVEGVTMQFDLPPPVPEVERTVNGIMETFNISRKDAEAFKNKIEKANRLYVTWLQKQFDNTIRYESTAAHANWWQSSRYTVHTSIGRAGYDFLKALSNIGNSTDMKDVKFSPEYDQNKWHTFARPRCTISIAAKTTMDTFLDRQATG